VNAQKARSGKIIGLLPGSRNAELTANLPTLLGAAQKIHAKHPDTRFLIACFKQAHLDHVQEVLRKQPMPYVGAQVGRTPEIIDLSQIVMAVSGSVSLELLYRVKPTVVVYRAAAFFLFLSRFMRKCKFISLPNLLADRELFPEYLSASNEAEAAGQKVIDWLDKPAELEQLRKRIQVLRNQAARPGACERSAQFIFDYVHERNSGPRSNAA
jgi:lipid-A-disaccharide synthase